jgi:hypothetical protein
MSPFEFFFSFYGLILGLSVAVMATGAARAFKHRKAVRVGWLTPLLAIFAALDIATFWDSAWNNFQHLSYSYGLLVAGLVIATVYFTATSLIFPEPEDEASSLDDHFWANKRAVLLLLIGANLLGTGATFLANGGHANSQQYLPGYGIMAGLYVVLNSLAAFSRRGWVVTVLLALQISLYLVLAAMSALHPNVANNGPVTAAAAPEVPVGRRSTAGQ